MGNARRNANTTNSTVDSIENRVSVLESPADVELFLNVGNGHGSTNTRIRRFTNVQKNTLGSYASYVDDSVFGASITINTAGVYAINYVDAATATQESFGISLNTNALGTNIGVLTYAQGKRSIAVAQVGPRPVHTGVTLRLVAGDIIRAHTDGTVNLTSESCMFQIIRIGE